MDEPVEGAGWSLAHSPFATLVGAGPVAWRQLMSCAAGLSRNRVFSAGHAGGGGHSRVFRRRERTPGARGGGLRFRTDDFAVLHAQLLQFDFRSDLDRIDVLKTLPASPAAIVLGELLAPVVFATLYELPFVIAIGLVQPEWLLIIVSGVVLVPTINLFVFAFENLVFLWFPCRLANLGAGDFQAFGRQMLVMAVKFMLVGIGGGLAAAAGRGVVGG